MTDQAQSNNNQMVMIALVVIAVLLAAIVGVLIWQQSRAAVPAPTQVPAQSQTGATTSMGAGAATGAGTEVDPASVDPNAATAVPKGTEPDAFVKAYYEACANGDWKAAYDALPADKKVGQTPEGLQEQVSGYGIKSYAVTDAKVEGDKATVTVEQVTGSYGTFVNQWTFVKKDGVWYAAGKAVTGMK